MKDPAAVSPFAAKSSQEQKEQWIWWQCQRDALLPVEERMEQPPEAPLKPAEEEMPFQPVRPKIYHSQYDAVIRRMRTAQKQASHYTSVSEESTTQP